MSRRLIRPAKDPMITRESPRMLHTTHSRSPHGTVGPLALAVALALGIHHTGVALAQEGDTRLKEMKVSAESDKPVQQRTELGKMTEYTPISGAVVTQEQVEHLQLVNNLLELGKRVPGISMIRNMRIPDGGKLYTENRIDGMRATATNTSVMDEVDGADIERIEVITGPASAL